MENKLREAFPLSDIIKAIIVAVAAYLLGCISTGTIISNKKGVNIRNAGSKNTGASNVLRVLGVKAGIVTFLGDFFKAALACLIGQLLLPRAFGVDGFGRILAGLFVILGHNWPVFFGFKGGKGVACSTAVLVCVDFFPGLIAIVLCVLVIWLTRFISLGSMVMLTVFMILTLVLHWGQWVLCTFSVIIWALCVWRHRANIQRLLAGTENKIGNRVAPAEETKGNKD
ncbi:MAG: glycerol-3-phosphate 1-O-acyltransferase PlsY [Clostridiales bacterium]|nr:glycerol-3-phosphate 1-O-acyltransferase PlsY [Clostridiales bacterium]